MGLAVEMFSDEPSLEPVREPWDELAVAAGRPFCAPAWMLAWWRHARPAGAGLRVLAALDGDRLVGIAPLWALRGGSRRSPYEVLAARLSTPAVPLAAPGREEEFAAACAEALARLRPRPSTLALEDVAAPAGWGELLAGAWPQPGAWVLRDSPTPLSTISLEGGFDEWFSRKSSKLRQESRRLRRRLEDAGAAFALAGPGELDRAVAAFERFHSARWEEQGGSEALVPGLRELLADVAAELMDDGRLRVYTIEAGGEVVAVNIAAAAGEQADGWNSGFDERWGRQSPSLQLTLHALRDAAERGERRMSLGPGGRRYKERLADSEEAVRVLTLVPRGLGYPLQRLRLAPRQARMAAAHRLSPNAKRRLRRLVGR